MKRYAKLHISALLLLMAVVMVVSVSYAAFTISSNPAMEKLQVSVGGSYTIKIAPDLTYVDENGQVFHYPGAFSDKMDFSEYMQYDYLQSLCGLVPVSTADGETWYIPTYYQREDALVQSGGAVAGQLRPTTEFFADDTLAFANLTAQDSELAQQGHYIYLDFWIMAPVDGYKVRVSDGDDSIGTYVIDLMDPEKNGDSYTLTKVNQQAASCIRLGFMVNNSDLLDNSMLYYSESAGFDSSVSKLKGVYTEADVDALKHADTRFTIFEPNGDLHPDTLQAGVENGVYIPTHPLGLGGVPVSVSDRLTMQLRTSWIMAQSEPLLAQMFQVFLAGKDLSDETEESLKQRFYSEYLLYPYLNKGSFIANTAALYAAAAEGTVSPEQLQGLPQGGATEDVYITELEAGVPQRIRLFIWLEGQDVDCINSAATGSFAISIELAGSNAS